MKILNINGLKYSSKHKIVKRIRDQYTLNRTQYTDWSISTDNDICFVHTPLQPFNDDNADRLISKKLIFNDSFLTFLENADYDYLVLCGSSFFVDNIFDKSAENLDGQSTSAFKDILNTNEVETIIFSQSWDNYKNSAKSILKEDDAYDDSYDDFTDIKLGKLRYDWFMSKVDDSVHTIVDEDALSEDEIYNLITLKLK
tara:strand:+ start:399 stop:995 length:597 start_codon:yes stop_codon:yes gene_type:complete